MSGAHPARASPRAQTAAPARPGVGTAVAALRRWHESGGDWVVTEGAGSLTISLRRCDGGEEVEQIRSDDPALLLLLDGCTSRARYEA